MPIRITDYTNTSDGEKGEEVAWLCDDSFNLLEQLEEFEAWLSSNVSLPKGKYSADIGFSPRSDAAGRDGIVSIDSMRIMVSIGMELYLSEYPQGLND